MKAALENTQLSFYKKNNIEKNCSSSQSFDFKNNELAKVLQESQNNFLTPSMRLKDPQGYIKDLNKIIALGGYGHLLGCVEEWRRLPRHTYEIAFFDISKSQEKSMHLGGEGIEIKLAVDLYSSFQRTLFAYAHELLHVCQRRKGQVLYGRIPKQGHKDYKDILGDYNRYLFQNEIEAFLLMLKMYEAFTFNSTRLCFEEHPKFKGGGNSFYSIYSKGKDELFSGILAQRVISWYEKPYKDFLIGVFEEGPELVDYPASLIGQEFKMGCLNKKMIKNLDQFGVLVKQNQCP